MEVGANELENDLSLSGEDVVEVKVKPVLEPTVQETSVQQVSSLPPKSAAMSLWEEEALRRDATPNVMTNSCVDEESSIICQSDEYGEYGMLKVIVARSAKLLGMQADKNKAVVIGRKVTFFRSPRLVSFVMTLFKLS
jgi:hypothetical protein